MIHLIHLMYFVVESIGTLVHNQIKKVILKAHRGKSFSISQNFFLILKFHVIN